MTRATRNTPGTQACPYQVYAAPAAAPDSVQSLWTTTSFLVLTDSSCLSDKRLRTFRMRKNLNDVFWIYASSCLAEPLSHESKQVGAARSLTRAGPSTSSVTARGCRQSRCRQSRSKPSPRLRHRRQLTQTSLGCPAPFQRQHHAKLISQIYSLDQNNFSHSTGGGHVATARCSAAGQRGQAEYPPG